MLYPQPQHLTPAPYPNFGGPVIHEAPAIAGIEPLHPADWAYLKALLQRRKLPAPAGSLRGGIRQQDNYTIAFLNRNGLPWAMGIAKRNPNCDEPDAIRGRQIALARALFDLLRAEGRQSESEPPLPKATVAGTNLTADELNQELNQFAQGKVW